MIQVKNLYHKYPNKEAYAVNDISFEINKGEIMGFLGPSGAGKSTVQNIMTGLLPLQKGQILYEGTSIKNLDKNFYNRLGVSFELPNLYEKLTGFENLKYYAGLYERETEDPLKVLDMVGLAEAAYKRAGSYSKGMKNRLVFARSIVTKPEIMFLDEPLSGLDPTTGKRIKEIIEAKRDEGNTIFLTTHNMFLAEEICDNVAFINEGRLIAIDTPKNLKLQYGSHSIKVEYRVENQVKTEIFFIEKEEDNKKLQQVINNKEIITMHSQEATLEQIFIKLTGRGLS